MKIDIVTLFPEVALAPLSDSIIQRARAAGIVEVRGHQLRDWSEDKHRRVDGTLCGGGQGMLLRPEPVFAAVEALRSPATRVLLMTPQGRPFKQAVARELAAAEHMLILCGHYEGVDQRVVDSLVDDEISIGDYVLTNGAIAAAVVCDAVIRLLPGALGDERSSEDESFTDPGLLEAPAYTRPVEFRGMTVPEILLSGNPCEDPGMEGGDGPGADAEEPAGFVAVTGVGGSHRGSCIENGTSCGKFVIRGREAVTFGAMKKPAPEEQPESKVLEDPPRVEPATIDDLPALTELVMELFALSGDFSPDRALQERGLRLILEQPNRGRIFIVRNRDRIFGMVNLLFTISTARGGFVILMEDVVVHPDHRSQGYGAMLVDYVMEFGKLKNFKRITLLTDRMSAETQEFFKKQGFEYSTMIPMRRIID